MTPAMRVRRNPVLGLAAISRLQALPAACREPLGALLRDLGADASARADACWARNKAPMAAYWKAVGVYARHIARAVEVAGRWERPERPSLPILVSIAWGPEIRTTLAAFLADNDGLADSEAAVIMGTIAAGKVYRAGGGAAVEWTIRRADA